MAKFLGRPSDYALISRYTAVGAPFMLVALATRAAEPAAARRARPGRRGGGGGNHRPGRDLLDPVAQSPLAVCRPSPAALRAGDAVVLAGSVAEPGDADYYVSRLHTSRPMRPWWPSAPAGPRSRRAPRGSGPSPTSGRFRSSPICCRAVAGACEDAMPTAQASS